MKRKRILSWVLSLIVVTGFFENPVIIANADTKANIEYETKEITQTKEQRSSTKDDSIFPKTIDYNVDGFEGTLNRVSVQWTPTYKFETKEIEKTLDSYENNFNNETYVTQDGYSGYIPKNGGSYKNGSLENKSFSVRETNSSNSFSSTKYYSSNGFSGYLNKDGSSRVISGSDRDSRTVYDTRSNENTNNLPSVINYSKGGYSGTLRKDGSPDIKTKENIHYAYDKTNSKYKYADTNNDGDGDCETCSQSPGFDCDRFDGKYVTDSHGCRAKWIWDGKVQLYGKNDYTPFNPPLLSDNHKGHNFHKVYGFRQTYFKYKATFKRIINTYTQSYKGIVTKPDTRNWEQQYSGNLSRQKYSQNYKGLLKKNTGIDYYTGIATYKGMVKRPKKPILNFTVTPPVADKLIFGEKLTYNTTVTNLNGKGTFEWSYKKDNGQWIVVGENPPEGFNEFGQYTIKARVIDELGRWSDPVERQVEVKCSLGLNATLTPSMTESGGIINFSIQTVGYANKLEIIFPDEVGENVLLDLKEQRYPINTQYKYFLPIDLENTKDKNGNRLREPYKFTVIASRRDGKKRQVVLNLEVSGKINSTIRTRVRN